MGFHWGLIAAAKTSSLCFSSRIGTGIYHQLWYALVSVHMVSQHSSYL